MTKEPDDSGSPATPDEQPVPPRSETPPLEPSAPAPAPPPGSGAIPGWGQQPATPPAPAGPSPAPPGSGAIPGWGQQPATPPAPTPTPSDAGGIPGWGQQPPPASPPPAQPPPSTGWGQQAPPASPPPAQPGWGQQPPSPPPSTPPSTWAQQPAPPPGAAVPPGQPGTWAPGQAPTTVAQSSGCLKFGLGITIGGCLLLLVALALLLFALSSFLGLGWFGFLGAAGDGDSTGFDRDCPYISDAEAREVLGGQADAILLEGIAEATIGFIMDTRALPTAEDCWITEGQRAYIARVAVHQGGDAGAVFAAERENAQPKRSDQGGGITSTREGYYGGEVPGLGDEAFCTGVAPTIMAGVLVRQGDRVVYASVGSESEGTGPGDLEPGEDDNAPISPGLCAIAQDLARAVLD